MTDRWMVAALVAALAWGCGDDDEPTATSTTVPPGEVPTGAPAEAPPQPMACTGEEHTCVMKATGEVLCAGENLEGELGDGTTRDRWAWTPVVGLTDAKAIECGARHTCAIRRSGEVSCWGRNRNGELGAGHTDVTMQPVGVSGLTGVAELSAGTNTTCARLGDGSVKCWGAAGSGLLGRDSSDASSTPLAIANLSGATAIAVGRAHACAQKGDGTVWCWGANNDKQLAQANEGVRQSHTPMQVPGLTGVSSLAAGGDHTCAVTAAGVSCWGDNDNGQCTAEAATDDPIAAPTAVAGLTGVRAMALGSKRSCALMADGSAKCWGYNNYTAGLLGIGPTEGVRDADAPTAVAGVTGGQSIDTSNDHTCVVDGAGGLTCWGAAGAGRMGNGSQNSLQAATKVVENIAAASGEASSLDSFPAAEGELTVEPHLAVGQNHVCGVKTDGHVYCFGEGGEGVLGNGSQRPNASQGGVEVAGISDAVQVTVGLRQSCALRRNGEVACWGRVNQEHRSSHPYPMSLGEPVKQISVGGSVDAIVLCGVHMDGTVSCLGNNWGGMLGRGSRSQMELTAAKIADLTDVEEVHVAVDSVCARQSSGKVFCWGAGRKGQLGNGATDSAMAPVEVSGLRDAVALGGGYYDHCAARRGGSYVCWGDNEDGQLANGQTGREANSATPVAIRGLAGVTTAGGTTDSMCAVTRSGPRCWGANDFGQTGSGDAETDDVTAPVEWKTDDEAVAALGDVIRMGCGSNYCCALHSGGGVSCAGSTPIGGGSGFLGMGNRRSATPIVAPGVTFAVPTAE